MTTDEFERTVRDWLATARHPTTKRLYTEMVYQPMLELLAYVRANGFKTFIVSGGGADFMRVFNERVYGIPPEQVVGSTGKVSFEWRDGKPVLMKLSAIQFVDDGPGKPVGINQFIAQRRSSFTASTATSKCSMDLRRSGNASASMSTMTPFADSLIETQHLAASTKGSIRRRMAGPW
jgi:hypothetical protein